MGPSLIIPLLCAYVPSPEPASSATIYDTFYYLPLLVLRTGCCKANDTKGVNQARLVTLTSFLRLFLPIRRARAAAPRAARAPPPPLRPSSLPTLFTPDPRPLRPHFRRPPRLRLSGCT